MTKGLQEAAESVDGVNRAQSGNHLRVRYPRHRWTERAEDHRQHDRIVFLFRTYWFNIMPMMKAYLN